MRIDLIRHGQVPGNREHRYVGITEEHLTEEGRKAAEQRHLPEPDMVFCSPRIRCVETAGILYPGCSAVCIPELAECNFGAFEYKNYRELSGDPDYQAWIDSGGTIGFPGGETMAEFRKRSVTGFRQVLRLAEEQMAGTAGRESAVRPESAAGREPAAGPVPEMTDRLRIAIVAHGGTVMAVLAELADPEEDYFHWQCGNLEGYTGEWNGGRITAIEKI